jgi:MATE family multidrug resistance protein
LFLIGRLGDVELTATSIAFTINMAAFLPMLGMGQAVSILVGQRLGQDRPHLAERSTWNGFRLSWLYMGTVAIFYVLTPGAFLFVFQSKESEADGVASLVPVLLRFVAVYSLFDSMNLIFSFALRGAGDTRFVTIMSLALAWPVMVAPGWASWYFGWGIYWAWTFVSAYVIILGLSFLWRFRGGKWKSMRVIERAPVEMPTETTLATVPAEA